MPTKCCTKCGLEKDIEFFDKRKHGKQGVSAVCKPCARIERKKYKFVDRRSRTVLREKSRKYRADNLEAVREKDRLAAAAKRKLNPDASRLAKREFYKRHRERLRKEASVRRAVDAEKYNERNRARRAANPQKFREQEALRRSTPKGRLENAIGAGVHRGLTNGAKGCRPTFEILGYSVDVLKDHLERNFQPGMSWDNYGPVWHVDHKLPLSYFEYSTPDCQGFKDAWNLSNLQPLWAKENLSKHAKILPEYANDNELSPPIALAA